MRGFLFGVVSFVVLVAQAQASNYPPDYGHQVVRVVHKGPALFAHVGSGMMEMEVFGYKNSGYLAQFNPPWIDAVITAHCQGWGGSHIAQTTVVRLGREWNGTGYLSEGISMYAFFGNHCRSQDFRALQVAYSDGRGRWDSRYGENYSYGRDDIWGYGARPAVFQTHTGGHQINMKAWDFIVDQMRR